MLASDSGVGVRLRGSDALVPECKIRQMGAIFVGVSGYFGLATGFNPYDVVRKVSIEGGGLIAIADRFELVALEPFKAFVEDFRREKPALFASLCNNQDCLEVVFIGNENGIPRFSTRCFRVTTPYGHIVVEPADHYDCPGGCETGAGQALLGMHENADALLNRTPNFWGAGEVKAIVAGMDELIEAEIKAKPKDVGLPISILIIDETGPHWAPGYQGVCPDIKSNK